MRTFLLTRGWMLAVLLLAIGCTLNATGDRGATREPRLTSATFNGAYAAMDEVPVVGGELRLVAPQVVSIAALEPAPGAAADPADPRAQRREALAFPLRHTAVTAKVAGLVGVYEIEQQFENPFSSPLEAVYLFPLGDDGAVSGYQITIGDRVIQGEIKARAEARRVYQEARAAGHTAALVEQQKPNLFMQHVANIPPRETVRVKLTYTELLDYRDGTYELAVPLTVGPRYLPLDRPGQTPVTARAAGQPAVPGTVSVPYADATIAASTVSFTAEIDAGVPIGEVRSPSHSLTVTAPGATSRRISLASAAELPNRDLVVHYATASESTMTGVLAHRTTDDGYVMLTVQPKARYRTGDVTPREVVLVVDTSGSMNGTPLAQAKAAGSAILQTLSERDTFNILQFASGVDAMAPAPVPGDAAGRQRGLAYLAQLHSGGGTEMDRGVAAMLAEKPGPEQVRIIYFLTDGYVGNDDVVVAAARRLGGDNRIMTIGIGAAPNRYLLDRLAEAGRGFATYLSLNENVTEIIQELVLQSAYPYLTDVEVDWGELEVTEVSPSPLPDVYAGQPLVLSGRYRRPGRGVVTVRGRSAGRTVEIPMTVTLPERHDRAPVAQLWARRKIEDLLREVDPEQGMSDGVRAQLQALGLAFSIVTQETSFVAVDRSRVVDGAGAVRFVEQPALMPEGMVGGEALAEPAPAASSSYGSSYSDNDSGGFWGSGATEARGARWLWGVAALFLGALLVQRRRGR